MQKGCRPSLSFDPTAWGMLQVLPMPVDIHALGFLQHEPTRSIKHRLKSSLASVHPSAIAISPVALLMVDTFFSILMLEIVHYF